MEAARHLPLLLRDGRRVLPLRRADLRHEVRQLDLRRIPGRAAMSYTYICMYVYEYERLGTYRAREFHNINCTVGHTCICETIFWGLDFEETQSPVTEFIFDVGW